MHEFVTVELLTAWPASVLEDKDQLALAERQCHLCTEAIDSPGLDVRSHSSAALGARGCILGKEFVTHNSAASAPVLPLPDVLAKGPFCSVWGAVDTQP